ncbi:MAG: class I SAM-dependent methyltransferase [Gammaproteobacteria bacterium]
MNTMTTMHDVLTDKDISTFVINLEILRYLELLRKKINLDRHEINVLDWGCGRGQSVSLLRELGYNTFGVDICAESLNNGATYFSKRSKYPENMLRLINPKGKIDFPENYFHFIFSYQVLEHVEHIEDLADEITRVLAPNGMCLHIYPAHKRVIEGHLFMPFIHWLPKNNFRKAFVILFVALGIEPRWRELKSKNILEKAQTYYNFSVNETFYRSPATNKQIFEERGLQTDFVIINNPILKKYGILSRIMNINYFKKLINWMLLNFKSVEILLVKP